MAGCVKCGDSVSVSPRRSTGRTKTPSRAREQQTQVIAGSAFDGTQSPLQGYPAFNAQGRTAHSKRRR